MIIAIDPGKAGAIAYQSGRGIVAHPLPVGGGHLLLGAIAHEIATLSPVVILLEKVDSRPTDGHVGLAAFMRGFGALQGIAAALDIPIDLVPPKEWQAETSAAYRDGAIEWCRSQWPQVLWDAKTPQELSRLECKAASIRFASIHFPAISLTPGRHKRPHDGIADALCLLEYGRRKFAQAA